MQESFETCYNTIMKVLRSVYKNFREGSPEVAREWKSQISQIDKSIEQVFGDLSMLPFVVTISLKYNTVLIY
jgi:uncharacterized protein (DUF885 family)